MSNVQQQRMVVEQLRREASIKRISVSQAVEDIKVVRARRLRLQPASDARIRTSVRASMRGASSSISIRLRRVQSAS